MSDNDKLDRLEQKIDNIKEDVGEIKIHIAVYNEQLKVHIKRTELLEGRIEPLEKHDSMIISAIQLVGILAALAAIAEVFLR